MIELTGTNLGERKKDLNSKISDALYNKANFEEIKSQEKISDVDTLYNIGVASKYKDVEYIILILKSGDSLYISKALKCVWLYDNEYSHIVNPNYLHENIFPLISLKVTKKILTAISLNLRKEQRVLEFYTYCDSMKHTNIALKFLLFIPDEFKLQTLKNANVLKKLKESDEFLRLFVGNNFDLAEAYCNTTSDYIQTNTLYRLRHLYFISNEKYLEMLRKFAIGRYRPFKKLGLRISKDIMKKHKETIYKNPIIYLRFLNISILVRYSTIDDAKLYAKTLISYECLTQDDFWKHNYFYGIYGFLLDKIPLDQRLQFIKNIFTDLFPKEEFETSKDFYRSKLYNLMTPDEREKWALKHIESGLELLGTDKDYKWYRFVSFNKAFDVIKKYNVVTSNTDTRNNMLTLLVESAKTDKELETLFDYYYKRHINEQRYNKKLFIDAVLSEHNVYNLSSSCWDAFNKILYSLEVYNLSYNDSNTVYRIVALIYHVIHGKEAPEVLNTISDLGVYYIKDQNAKLSKEKQEIVYNYIMKLYFDKIKTFDDKTYNDEVKQEVKKYINFILDIMYFYKKSKEDIPEIFNKYIKLDFETYSDHCLLSGNEGKVAKKSNMQQHMISYLKKDKELVVSYLPVIKDQITKNTSCYKLNTLLKILRTYFSNDLAITFLKFFKDIIIESKLHLGATKTAVYGILELADNDFKKDFISKHFPTEAKINRRKVDRNILNIQKSICTMACYSRPPLPLSDIMKYIKGDYIHFCLPVFNSYMARMPKSLNIEIVKSLLDTPLSVQKHGIRLAFKCFSVEDLRKLISDVWIKTKSVSLRSVIYAALLNKIVSVEENAQNELFEDLKLLTSRLSEDDIKNTFKVLTSDCLPRRLIGKYLEVVWNLVDKFPEKSMFILLRRKIIDIIERNIYLINKEVIETVIYAHVNLLLKQEKMKLKVDDEKYDDNYFLMKSKFALFHKYTSFFTDDSDFRNKADLVMIVIKECLKMWNTVENNEYIYKKILSEFIISLNENSYEHDAKNYAKNNLIFEKILNELQDTLPSEEIYEIVWRIRICVITRNIIIDGKGKLECNMNHDIIIKQSLITYGEKFMRLLIESIESQKCYVSFFDYIRDAIKSNLRLILINLNYEGNLDEGRKLMYAVICSVILEYNSFETYMFALKLLPWNIDQYKDRKEYVNVINKLKSCEYSEVKSYMYDKYNKTYL